MAEPVKDPALLAQLNAQTPKPVADESLLAQLNAADVPDKYKAAALEEAEKYKAAGIPTEASYARRAIQGTTFNGADEVLAGLMTPFEMAKRGTFNPAEGYRYAKAREDLQLEEARKNQGILGTAMEIGGGVVGGSSLARGGLSMMGRVAPNAGLGARSLAAGADAAGYGAIAGALDGNSLEERAKNAGIGATTGGIVGGATPGVLKVAGTLLSPIASNISAWRNPQQFGRTQVARSIMESGMPVSQIADDVTTAAREGQDVFTLADALGNPGQRMLSSVTRAPGAGRTNAVNFLEGRQAGQGRRLANTLAEGFDSPHTAAQVQAATTQARDTAANAAYGSARRGAAPVDVTRVLSNIDDTIAPGVSGVVNPGTNIADDSIESVLRRYRGRLTDGQSNLTDYTAVERVRGDLADEVQKAVRSGAGNRARLLGQALREMDTAMESASPGFRQANRDYSTASRVIDAIDEGRLASGRGRSEDVIRNFRGRPAAQQDAFRAGYVDPLIAQVQGPASGVNKARQFTSDAFRDEAAAIAPMRTQSQMGRRIDRENIMFDTRNQALGGSRTADNLADAGAMGVDPSLVANVLSGNFGGMARNALSAVSNSLSGNTPAVREEVGRILLTRGNNVSTQQMQDILQEAIRRIESRQLIAAQLGRGASSGLAVAPSASGARR